MINKKGFAYLTAVSLIVAVIIVVFLVPQTYTRQDEQSLISSRVGVMNDFVKGLNQDVERATEISSYRALLALEDHSAVTGKYYSDLASNFSETFYTGYIEGEKHELMQNSTFLDYLKKVNEISSTIGITTNVTVVNVSISQYTPWLLEIVLRLNVNLTDRTLVSNWNYERDFVKILEISNLRDPLYSVSTQNKIPNTIRIFNESPLVTTSSETDNLQLLINGSYYIASPYSPSFLDRFENNTNASPNGIESIVNIHELSDQDIEVFAERIKVDYMYFNDLSEVPGDNMLCKVQNIPDPDDFIITEFRVGIYQIENLTYNVTDCP